MDVLDGKLIVLGVSGGIAAYKAAALASLFVQEGALVDVILSTSARGFIQPLTFSAITHRPVHTDLFAPWDGDFAGHVTLAERADLLVVAPATANSIARIALGLADDFLSLVALSTEAPLLVAPAMEHRMYHHPATQEHLRTIRERGAVVVGPETGRLASGAVGDGRLAAPEVIQAAAQKILAPSGPLLGRKVVVTAGGTREPIDPVRFLGNRSSGRMGFALAEAALDAGAEVTLIAGPTSANPPPRATTIVIETARQMQVAVDEAVVGADVLIMAAAVADFRSEQASEKKIKKEPETRYLDLRLVRNPDILAEIDRPGLIKIGFAAETDDLLDNAQRKLVSKGLAMIVANDAEATIGAADSKATLIFAHSLPVALPLMSKEVLAAEIVRAAAELLDKSAHNA